MPRSVYGLRLVQAASPNLSESPVVKWLSGILWPQNRWMWNKEVYYRSAWTVMHAKQVAHASLLALPTLCLAVAGQTSRQPHTLHKCKYWHVNYHHIVKNEFVCRDGRSFRGGVAAGQLWEPLIINASDELEWWTHSAYNRVSSELLAFLEAIHFHNQTYQWM